MASPNISELATVAIESRRRRLADNVTDNTALLSRMKQRGKIRTVSGGRTIYEELEYAENATYRRFTGYETLNIQPSDVMTAAEYDFKQAAVAVTISEREALQNSGKEKMIDLLEGRIGNAEKTFVNRLSGDLYSDGTADGGKQVGGLAAAIPSTPAVGVYGGINRASWPFWQPKKVGGVNVGGASNILEKMMELWTLTCRNMDKVDLMPADNVMYRLYWQALQVQQRFMNPELAKAGFTNLKFLSADVVLDGGVGGSAPDQTMYFLNTDYIHWRPHRDANMVPLDDRFAINQAAMVKLIHWMGNLTMSNASLQGVLTVAA